MSTDVLERRITKLEQRNKRMQNLVFAIGFVAILPWVIGAAPQKIDGVVRATELQLVVGDSVYGILRPVPTGIAVYNGSNIMGVALNARTSGGAVLVYNAAGKIATSMFARPDSAGEVGVRSPDSKWLGGIWGSSSSGGAMAVQNSAGVAVVNAFANKNGGQVMISNNSGKGIGWLFANDEDAGSVQVGTGNGSYSVNMQSFADRSGKVDVTNSRSVPIIAMGVGPSGSALFSAAASDGKPVFQAGADDNGGYASIMNLDHTETASLANQPTGRPMLGFMTATRRVMELFVDSNSANLQLYSLDGTVLHSVPDR